MDEENKKFELAGKTYTEGSEISIDGTTGNIYDGIIPTVDATIAGEFGRIMAWADNDVYEIAVLSSSVFLSLPVLPADPSSKFLY